jgi:hypothetical protein
MATEANKTSGHRAVLAFDEELHSTIAAHAKALYPTRALELQRAAADAFADLEKTALSLKSEAVRDGDEDAAARLLMGECIAETLHARLRLWLAFRNGDMDAAWAWLVRAQNAATAGIRAHALGDQLRPLSLELQTIEDLVFPPQMFISTGWITRRSECTICAQPFGSCQHVNGRVYGGEFASRLVTEGEPLEVSVVDVPDDKMCRAYTMTVDGIERDVLTWGLPQTSQAAPDDASHVIES